jgi:hypothetical protein
MVQWSDCILPLIFVFFFLFCIDKSKRLEVAGIPKRWFQILFLSKVAFGILLWWIYTYYEPYKGASDAFLYFNDGLILGELAESNPQHFFRLLFGIGIEDPALEVYFDNMHRWWCKSTYGIANDNPTIIRINGLIALVSLGNFHVHTVFMCFISTLAAMFLLKAVRSVVQLSVKGLFFLMLLAPSYLFWTSGVLKEAPLMLALALFLWAFFDWVKASFKSVKHVLLMVISGYFLFHLKGYVFLSLIPALSFWLIGSRLRFWRLAFLAVHAVFVVVAMFADRFYSAGDFLYVLSKKQTDFINVANKQAAGSQIEAIPIDGWLDFTSNLPIYWITTFFRPFLGEGNSLLQHFSALETSMCLLLLFLALIFRRHQSNDEGRLTLFVLSFLLILAAIIGATVPVLGAVVRYKVPLLPFFGLLIALIIDPGPFEKVWKSIRSVIFPSQN